MLVRRWLGLAAGPTFAWAHGVRSARGVRMGLRRTSVLGAKAQGDRSDGVTEMSEGLAEEDSVAAFHLGEDAGGKGFDRSSGKATSSQTVGATCDGRQLNRS